MDYIGIHNSMWIIQYVDYISIHNSMWIIQYVDYISIHNSMWIIQYVDYIGIHNSMWIISVYITVCGLYQAYTVYTSKAFYFLPIFQQLFVHT